MGKLRMGHLVEAAFWLGFAAIALFYSFDFDRPIEIYRFGAAAWPRAVIFLIAVSALAQLYWQWRFGDEDVDAADNAPDQGEDATQETGLRYYLQTGIMFALPLLYAYFLNDLGFYASTPFFIVAILLLMGERRLFYLITVTLGVWIAIIIVFGKLLYVGLPTGNVSPFYEFSNWLLVLLRG